MLGAGGIVRLVPSEDGLRSPVVADVSAGDINGLEAGWRRRVFPEKQAAAPERIYGAFGKPIGQRAYAEDDSDEELAGSGNLPV